MNRAAEDLNYYALTIRRYSLAAIHHAGSGHPGGALSCADLLAYLMSSEIKWKPEDAGYGRKNRLVLSKGHACPALYAAAAEQGLLQKQALLELRKLGSLMQGHPHVGCLPWVETSTGSLGQGFSVAIGMALGLRYKGELSRTYVILGDGELQEGEIWEGAMFAAHHKLDNLCAIIDYNKMQSDDLNENIIGLEPLLLKWEAFNWHVIQIDGHNFEQIEEAVEEAKMIKEKPVVIIAHTIKGKGVSYMEGSPLWHGSVKLSSEELERALSDLDTRKEDIGRFLDGAV